MTPFAATFIVERVPRIAFVLSGERPLGYLHDVLAQDVAALTPGHGAIAAVLTANGRVAAEVRVLPLESRVLLDAEPAARPGIAEHVVRHAPLAGYTVSEATDRFAFASMRGLATDDSLAAAGLPVPANDDAAFERDDELLVVRVRWGEPGVDLIGPPDVVATAVERIDAPRASLAQLDAARITAGRPLYGPDVNEELLVNETPLLSHGVSMSKGCYPGQESVARIHNRGRIRRALRMLRSDTSLPPEADVLLDGTTVGRVTSAAASPDGTGVGIALLDAEIELGSTVRIDGTDAVVGELP